MQQDLVRDNPRKVLSVPQVRDEETVGHLRVCPGYLQQLHDSVLYKLPAELQK